MLKGTQEDVENGHPGERADNIPLSRTTSRPEVKAALPELLSPTQTPAIVCEFRTDRSVAIRIQLSHPMSQWGWDAQTPPCQADERVKGAVKRPADVPR